MLLLIAYLIAISFSLVIGDVYVRPLNEVLGIYFMASLNGDIMENGESWSS